MWYNKVGAGFGRGGEFLWMRIMVRRIFFAFCVLVFSGGLFAETSELKAVEFKQKGEISLLELTFDKDRVDAKRFHIAEDKQIILDLKDVKATERVMRAFDTSEFSGSVVFISSYKKPGSKNDIRVAVQLRDNVRSVIKRLPNRIVLEIENRFGAFGHGKASELVASGGKEKGVELAQDIHIPKSDSIEDILENLTLSGRKKYIGKRITLNVKDMRVSSILQMISEASGFNIILRDDIKQLPPLSLNLTNLPWDQVLDTILRINNLVAKKNGIILMIQTIEAATAEARKDQEAEKLNISQEALVTKVFPISYADLGSLRTILSEYLTPSRGKISPDKRTNSLIIRDSQESIDRIKKIIETLDTQTPQVLIESKIVEVAEEHSKELGLREGLSFGYDPVGQSEGGETAGPGLIGKGGSAAASGKDGGPGFVFSSSSGTGKEFIGLSIGKFNRLFNLNFRLQLLETETKAKVISSPKIVTQDNTKASLVTRETSFYPVQESSDESTKVTFKEQVATVQLDVTPQITNEGSILLDIQLKRDDFADRLVENQPKRKLTNDLKTSVLVDNGSTIVLGGIYTHRNNLTVSGVPFLKNIPIIGWLFKSLYNPSSTKRELIMFITPRIINQAEAGLGE